MVEDEEVAEFENLNGELLPFGFNEINDDWERNENSTVAYQFLTAA